MAVAVVAVAVEAVVSMGVTTFSPWLLDVLDRDVSAAFDSSRGVLAPI